MKKVDSLHNKAMEVFDEAFLAKKANKKTLALELFNKSLELEIKAAELLRDNFSAEPSRSVLYRSAASIAVQCKQYSLAEELIDTALSGMPPEEIAVELKDILRTVQKHHNPEEIAERVGVVTPATVQKKKRAEKVGVVKSDKMIKTVVVRVDRLVKHPIYRKYVKRRKNLMARDDLGAKTGDKVRIVETRPLSARKRWKVIEILPKRVQK